VAWILRVKNQTNEKTLTSRELGKAEGRILRASQSALTSKVIKKEWYRTLPFHDEYGTWRSYSRIPFEAGVGIDVAYLILLNLKPLWASKLVMDIHKKLKHAPTTTVVAAIRQKYFAPAYRAFVKG
jgi:hypothetical protein